MDSIKRYVLRNINVSSIVKISSMNRLESNSKCCSEWKESSVPLVGFKHFFYYFVYVVVVAKWFFEITGEIENFAPLSNGWPFDQISRSKVSNGNGVCSASDGTNTGYTSLSNCSSFHLDFVFQLFSQ